MMIEPAGPIVVEVDGSAGSLAALDLAAEEAAARVTPLLVVFVAPGTSTVDRRRAGEVLDAAVARALAEHPALSASAEVVTGDPVEALLAAVDGAGLAVVGERWARNGGSAVLRLLSGATVPVMVFRPFDTAAGEDRPVLVGVAAGVDCDQVLGFAFEAADLRGASLHAVHADSGSSALDIADRMLDGALAAWSEKYPQILVRRTVRRGVDAAVALVAASHSAQLAVVGASARLAVVGVSARWAGPPDAGSGARPGVLAGSVAAAMVHRGGCPVVVVPAAALVGPGDGAVETERR